MRSTEAKANINQLYMFCLRTSIESGSIHVRPVLGLLLGSHLGRHRARLRHLGSGKHPQTHHCHLDQLLTLEQNLALSRTYYDYFKKGVRGLSSYTRSGTRSNNNSNNYQLSNQHNSKGGVFSRNDPYAAFDGHQPGSNVRVKGSRRDSSAGSDQSDEVPLGRNFIKREIEFSVQDAETGSTYDDRRREPGLAV